jgi:hypothetical protein
MTKRGLIQRLAEATGVNQATVRRALASEGMQPTDNDLDFAAAVKIVKANADPALISGHASNGRGEGGNSDSTSTLAEARARAENFRARKLEIENAKAEGKLIDREAVMDTGTHIIATARTALLSLGHRLAEKVAGKTDIGELVTIIENEVRDVLGTLADEAAFFAALETEALS